MGYLNRKTGLGRRNWDRLPFKPQAVLFDLDGTLVETDIDFTAMKRGVLELAARYGQRDPSLQQLDILGVVRESAGQLPAPEADALRAEAEGFLAGIELRACEGAREIPHAAALLERLVAERIGIGIVTRNCRASAEWVLERFRLPHDVLLTRNDVLRTKPDPEHLLLALRQLAATPDRAVMVGDHRMDVEGGARAGMWTVGVLGPGRPDDFFDDLKPDRIVRSLREVLEWIFPSY